MQLGNLQRRTGSWELRHHASFGDVLPETDRTGIRCTIPCWNSSRMSSRPSGGEHKHSHDSGSERKTHWCPWNGHAAVRVRESCLWNAWDRRGERYYLESLSPRG